MLSTVLSFIQNNILENGFSLSIQVIPTQLDLIDGAGTCLQIGLGTN
jgi:hypothetical protein